MSEFSESAAPEGASVPDDSPDQNASDEGNARADVERGRPASQEKPPPLPSEGQHWFCQ